MVSQKLVADDYLGEMPGKASRGLPSEEVTQICSKP